MDIAAFKRFTIGKLGRHRYNRRSHYRRYEHSSISLLQTTKKANPNNETLPADSPLLEGFDEATFFMGSDHQPCGAQMCHTLGTKDACLNAAQSVGLAHSAVTETPEAEQATTPRGCYEKDGAGLFFNPSTYEDDIDGGSTMSPTC